MKWVAAVSCLVVGCSDAMVEGDAGPAIPDATMGAMDGSMPMTDASGPCPSGMAFVRFDGGAACVDLYEGAILVGEKPWPWYDPIDKVDGAVRAIPAMGIYPQGYISQVQAAAACAGSGKRLCTLEEWTAACRGRPDHDFVYPYGNAYDSTACNEGRESPIVRLFGPNPSYSYQELNDPRCDQLDGGLAKGGDFPKCKSSYGAVDMHGNLHEWVDDGSFVGGYFVDAKINGAGCSYRTTAHAKTYHDYSTGFRCCADPK